MSSSPDHWNFQMSRRAIVPGRNRRLGAAALMRAARARLAAAWAKKGCSHRQSSAAPSA